MPRRVSGTVVYLDDELREAAASARQGRISESFDRFMSAFYTVFETGYLPTATKILRRASQVIRDRQLSLSQLADRRNAEGLLQQGGGDLTSARISFEESRSLARRARDRAMIAIAELNLGVVALRENRPRDAERQWRAALRLALAAEDYRTASKTALNLASSYLDRGRTEEASALLASLEQPLSLGPADLRASLHGLEGHVARLRGDLPLAEKYYRRALRDAKRAGDRSAEATTRQILGAMALDREQPGRAIPWLESATDLAFGLSDVYLIDITSRTLAVALHRRNRSDEALIALRRANRRLSRITDPATKSHILIDLAALEVELGHATAARHHLDQALPYVVKTHEPEWLERALRGILHVSLLKNSSDAIATAGDLALQFGVATSTDLAVELSTIAAEHLLDFDYQAALRLFDSAQTTVLERNGLAKGAWRAALTASILASANRPEDALLWFGLAASLARRASDRRTLYHVHNDRALVYARTGQQARARRDMLRAIDIASRLDDHVMLTRSLLNKAELDRQGGRQREALTDVMRVLEIVAERRDLALIADAECAHGLILIGLDRWEEARGAFESALAAAKESGNRPSELAADAGLADVAFNRGDYATAAQLFERASAHDEPNGLSAVQVVETLSGALTAHSALGGEADMQRVGQELVSFAERHQLESSAAQGFQRAARSSLERGSVDSAAGLYAAAIGLAGTAASRTEGTEALVNATLDATVALFLDTAHVCGEASFEEVRSAVVAALNRMSRGLGKTLNPVLGIAEDAARSALAST